MVEMIILPAVILVLLAIGAAYFAIKKPKKTIDYKQYYNIGIAWIPLGIVFMIIFENINIGAFFFVMGLAYISIGMKNKKKWGKKIKLTKRQIKIRQYSMVLLSLLVILGIIVFFLFASVL